MRPGGTLRASPSPVRGPILRRLLAPRWLLGHVVVLTAVVVMVNLGFWQLRRMDEVRTFNATLEQRQAAPTLSEGELRTAEPDELPFRRATVTGVYVPDQELLHLARGYQGRSGNHVLTPLVTGGGLVVLVDRGWVPASYDEPPVEDAAPPTGEVTITGQLFASQEYARFGARDAEQGDLARVLRVNLPRIEQQLPDTMRPLFPLYLQLRSQDPSPGDLPIPAAIPELDDGPHLGYAVQWFLFATTALVAYGMFVRRRLMDDRRGPHVPPVLSAGSGAGG